MPGRRGLLVPPPVSPRDAVVYSSLRHSPSTGLSSHRLHLRTAVPVRPVRRCRAVRHTSTSGRKTFRTLLPYSPEVEDPPPTFFPPYSHTTSSSNEYSQTQPPAIYLTPPSSSPLHLLFSSLLLLLQTRRPAVPPPRTPPLHSPHKRCLSSRPTCRPPRSYS